MRAIFLALTAVVLVACSRSEFDQLRREYLAGCTGNGATDEMCECSFDKLQEKYPPEVMVGINRRGIPPDGFANDVVHSQMLCFAGSPQSLSGIGNEVPAKPYEAGAPVTADMDVSALGGQAVGPADEEARVRARYEAEWGTPMPEESLADVQERYDATDSIMNIRYKEAMERLEPDSQQQLRERQRAWLRERDQKCGTQDGRAADIPKLNCLIAEVSKRTRVIDNWR